MVSKKKMDALLAMKKAAKTPERVAANKARNEARAKRDAEKAKKGIRTSIGKHKVASTGQPSPPPAQAKPKPQISIDLAQPTQQPPQATGQPAGQPAQPQGFGSKVLQGIADWFKSTPIGSAITGTEYQPPGPKEAGLAGVPLAGALGRTFGAAAKLGAKELAKRTAAMAARQAVIKSQYTFKQVASAAIKQGTNPLSGSTAKAAAGKIVFGRDAAGKLASSLKGWGKTIPPNIYPLNTKTAAKTTSYLKKLGYSATAIGIISGYLFSIPWSLNEKSDALTTITIAQRDAAKAGDWDTVAEYDALIQEISDVSWAETLTPFYNVGAAVMDKFKAAKITSEKRMEEMRKAQTEGEGEEDTFNQQAEARQESFEEYNTMAFERQQQADQEMQQFWQNYLDQKQAGEEEAREFWAEYQQNKQDFWKAFQENKTKSHLGFGLLQ